MAIEEHDLQELAELRVLVIEDSFESRNLIKSELAKFGLKKLRSEENGSKLLRENKPLEVDIVLVGVGLGFCHSGIELIKAFELASLLPVWCKVIFITNSNVMASSSHPSRYLKCEVLSKPINPHVLCQLIEEGQKSILRYQSVLQSFYNNQLDGLKVALESLPQGELTTTQFDELTVIHAHILLRLGQGNDAWQLTHNIKDELCRATNKLAIANALGDERKLKLTMGMLKVNPLMHKRGLVYKMYQAIKDADYKTALDCFKHQPKHQYSLADIELDALLKTEATGLVTANKFLTFKLGTSLENGFFRHSVKMIMLKCNLYVLFADLDSDSFPSSAQRDVIQLLDNTQWDRGSVDFSQIVPFVRCAMRLLNDPKADQFKEYQRLQGKLVNHDFFALLLMSYIAFTQQEHAQARKYLLRADEIMLPLEISPEVLIGQMWFKRMFNTLVPEEERAREYNSIGIHHTKQNKPFPALQMFFQSHLCAPEHASIAINLLDAFTKLGLLRYWHIEASQLVTDIEGMNLRDNEQRKYNQVLVKLAKLAPSLQ